MDTIFADSKLATEVNLKKETSRDESNTVVSSSSEGTPSTTPLFRTADHNWTDAEDSRKISITAKTLYACKAEQDSELSFEAGQIICDIRPSDDDGWIYGNLNGSIGLIPQNYVEFIYNE